MNNTLSTKLINKSKEIYKRLCEQQNESLTKEQIISYLKGGNEDYYSYIVSALASTGKITKKSGRTGGIDLVSTQGMQRELVKGNINKIQTYFKQLDIDESIQKKPAKSESLEKDFYIQLKSYLNDSGMYDTVEVIGENRKGDKWENPDLVCIKFNRLQYHFGIFPVLTTVEVKREFPSITHVLQTASYLNYGHSAYLCFYDSGYRGRNVDAQITRLRDEGIWDLSNVFNIGLIVSYKPLEKSHDLDFQLIKEAPLTQLDSVSVEEGIKLWLSDETRNKLSQALKEQLTTIIQG